MVIKRDSSRRPTESNSKSSAYSQDSPPRRSNLRSSSSSSSKKRKISEEDIAEYLAKKAQKKAIKVAKRFKSQAISSGYANDSNPFGDSNLNERFVWRKKIELDVIRGVPLDMFSVKAEKKRQKERIAEIEKVKKRREERAIEKAQHEEERALLSRELARAEVMDWEKKEEEFYFDQSKLRSEIRMREGRIKPIDVLLMYLNPSSDDFDLEIEEPYVVFKGLTVKEIEQLHEDIKLHLNMDRATPTHIEYWEALLVVCEWELTESWKKDALDRAKVRREEPPAELIAEERGLHSSVETDVKNLLQGKTYDELDTLQFEIESQMHSGTAKVVEYWEAVIKRLKIYKAKACLKEIHAKMLRKHLERLEQQPLGMKENIKQARNQSLTPIKEEEFDHDAGEPTKEAEKEDAGSFSPQLVHGDETEEAVDPEEDRAILKRARMVVLEKQQRRIREASISARPASSEYNNMEMRVAMRAMEEGDVVFGNSNEVNVDSQVYWWHDKYRPRKPKYLNRVHTGYEWNKYNQTHYDHDNPPPKFVQGYKFNIFYTDLVDKTKVPEITIHKDGDNADTCIIRFHAGPPYEDIAFRIVNKEWEYSKEKGFKSTFERGILQLYFNFIRYRYRR